MANPTRLPGDLHVQGTVYATGSIEPQSGNQDADRLQHIHKVGCNFDLALTGTPVAREEIIFVASTSGTLRRVEALMNVTGDSGVASSTFDIEKNGTSVLSSVITLNGADTDATPEAGSISTTTFAADDIFTAVLAVSDSTNAQGPFCWAEFEENAS